MTSVLLALYLALSSVSISGPMYPVPVNGKEAATQFWKERVKASGQYDFRLAEVHSEASEDGLKELPHEAANEIRSLVASCVGQVESFEDRLTDLLAETYTREQLVMLRDLLQTEPGRDWLMDRADLDDELIKAFDGPLKQKALFQEALDSGLIEKYSSTQNEFFVTINQWADPVIEFRDESFARLVFEVKEAHFSNLMFSSPLEKADTNGLLRLYEEPLDCVSSYLAREGWQGQSLKLVTENAENSEKRIGDEVRVLLSFGKGNLDTQWIIKVELVEKTKEERARFKEAKVTKRYTSFGGSYEFSSEVEAYAIRMIGPFKPQDNAEPEFEPKVSDFRILLQGDRLEFGLHTAASFITRFRYFLNEHAVDSHGLVRGRGKPFSEEQIAKTTEVLKDLAITPEEDRAYAGSYLANWEFFQIVAKTPQLRFVLMKVAKLSPLTYFKYKKHGILVTYMTSAFDRLEGIEALEGLPVYTYPIRYTIDSKPVLLTRFIVTEPRPPLRNVAGIYGFVAASPDDPKKRLVMRVLSGKRGPVLPEVVSAE